MSFIFGKNGAVSLWQTFKRLNPLKFFADVFGLRVDDYDLVINDFEPVSAWACKLRKVPCIALSHQSAVLHKNAPVPKSQGWVGKFVLRSYAPVSEYYGFHFKRYGSKIFPPVIRNEVQALSPTDMGHYTVYLPAYDDNTLIKFLHRFKKIKWQVFSKHNKEAFQFENIAIQPVNNAAFLESMASCSGALLGAGFEGPAEALYLNKKLMVVPMKRQYEQQCNAAALAAMGIPVIQALSANNLKVFYQWLELDVRPEISFPRQTASLAVEKLMEDFLESKIPMTLGLNP